MAGLSAGASLAWKIAAFEALQARAELIGREHLLIGLFSLEKVLSTEDFRKHPQDARTVLAERDALDYLLRHSGQDAAALRRQLRRALVRGDAAGKKGTMHRSPSCRRVFERAGELAGKGTAGCVQLFHAILEDPGPVILKALDRDFTHGGKGGGAGPLTARMSRSIGTLREEAARKEELKEGVEGSRRTLSSLQRDSGEYRHLAHELKKKTLMLAGTCLEFGDCAGLVFALEGLVSDAGACRDELVAIIAQLRFLGAEGISMQESSKNRIRGLLGTIEQQGRGKLS